MYNLNKQTNKKKNTYIERERLPFTVQGEDGEVNVMPLLLSPIARTPVCHVPINKGLFSG